MIEQMPVSGIRVLALLLVADRSVEYRYSNKGW